METMVALIGLLILLTIAIAVLSFIVLTLTRTIKDITAKLGYLLTLQREEQYGMEHFQEQVNYNMNTKNPDPHEELNDTDNIDPLEEFDE